MDAKNASVKEVLKKAVILIPSLEPDDRLPAYIRKLLESGFGQVVVVDDGSSAKYQPIFGDIAALPQTQVLHHDVNHGKGVALKTGYAWIKDNLPDVNGVITADADGQHAVKDCVNLAMKLAEGKRALYLGSRDFGLKTVPLRSKLGNRSTSLVFMLLYGKWLPDTQTGLRAFRWEDLSFMLSVGGERFEYEMNVLVACCREKLPMIPITIETIYENENKGTHYNTLKDSSRILKVILGGFVKFMGASSICTLLDQGLFNLLNLAVFQNGAAKESMPILAATAIARVFSAVLNFALNKNFVFKLKNHTGCALTKYVVLCIAVMLLSAGGVGLLGLLHVNSTFAKLLVDLVLYFVSYSAQQKWVFSEGK